MTQYVSDDSTFGHFRVELNAVGNLSSVMVILVVLVKKNRY